MLKSNIEAEFLDMEGVDGCEEIAMWCSAEMAKSSSAIPR